MPTQEVSLGELARKNQFSALEDRWLTAIEEQDQRDDLLDALEVVNKSDRSDLAADLASTWLGMAKEQTDEPETLLELARELILRCGDSQEIREELVRLYKEVHGDRTNIDRLIEASGLTGAKTPRRALRTLEIYLNLSVGDKLVHRSDETAAEVTEIDDDIDMVTLRTPKGTDLLEPDALGLGYDPVDPLDFRVLTQLYPDKVTEFLETDPAGLIVGILHSHQNQIDSDHLRDLLCPSYLPDRQWASWWSKARTEAKKNPHIGIEGRNPIVLEYHADGITLEDEIKPQWKAAETIAQKLAVIEAYFREARNRHSPIEPTMVKRFQKLLQTRIKQYQGHSPSLALAEALVLDRLAQLAEITPADPTAADLIAKTDDLPGLLGGLQDAKLYRRALRIYKETHPEQWAQLFAQLLPVAPMEACPLIADALVKAGQQELFEAAVARIPDDYTAHWDALCWLYRGPEHQGTDPMGDRELLLSMLGHLTDLSITDSQPPEVLRNIRARIRTTLSHQNYKRFREIIGNMDPGLASTVRRTIDRSDDLGQSVRSDLLKIIRRIHPTLETKKVIDPWEDNSVIYTTQAGQHKAQEELNYITNVKIPENAKAIGEAAAHGDLSENSEYKFALEERDLLQARQMKLQNELDQARVLERNDIDTNMVNIGTRVQLTDDQGDTHTLTILGPWDGNIEQGIYNYKAPLCQKLKCLAVGDTVNLNLDDQEKAYKIVEISNALN